MRRVGIIAIVLVIAMIALMMGCGAFLGLDEPETPDDASTTEGGGDDGPITSDGSTLIDAASADASLDGDAPDVCVHQGGSCGSAVTCCANEVEPGLGEAFTCTRDNTCALCTITVEPCDAAVVANPCCEQQAICSKNPNDLQSEDTHCCWPFMTPCDNSSTFKCCSGKCKPDGSVDGGPGCALK